MHFLDISERICVIAFVLTSMGSMGLSLTVQEILEPFKSTRLVVSALLASFVLVPLVAYTLTRTIPMNQSLAIALLLVGTATGAPMMPKLVEFARGNLAQAVGLMALQMAATIVYMPLVLPMLLPGARTRAWTIAKPLLLVVLPSLAMGLLIRTFRKNTAERLQPVFRLASNSALFLLIIFGLAANYSNVLQTTGLEAVISGALLLLIALGIGLAIGGPSTETRKVLALGTAQRNFSVAFLVGVENFRESDVLGMLALLALLTSLVLVPIAFVLGKLLTQRDASPM
jgi:bile acid:Na+ symporter, BASS family